MTRVSGKEMMSLSLVFLLLQLSSAFVVQNRKFTGTSFLDTTKTTKQNNVQLFSTKERGGEVVDVVLEALEKRLKDGSLSFADTNAVMTASDTLLEHLELVKDVPTTEKTNDVVVDEAEDYEDDYEDEDSAQLQLLSAVGELNADAVSDMIKSGTEMNEATTDAAFWAVVNSIDRAEANDQPLSGDVAKMIHHILDADLKHLLTREKITTNVTCMQPDDSGGEAAAARKMNYIFDDADHKNLPLAPGRKCEGGQCCDKCSRNIFPTFATDSESNLDTFPEICSLTFNNLETVSAASILQFVRLVERVRRTIAHEYGLPLSTILPLQAYSRKYVAGSTQQGGGGGEGDFVTLHTDEATHDGYHYSCVLYLSTQGVDFEGGDFVFNDPAEKDEELEAKKAKMEEEADLVDDEFLEALRRGEFGDSVVGEVEDNPQNLEDLEEEIRRAGRKLTPFHPTRGAAVIFSSGWENMHEVEKITSGVRYAVPCFFTTCPVPDAAYTQMKVGKPKTDEDIADDWLHLLLAHRKEEPMESVGRVKELLMKWHYMCTPLSEH